MTALQWYIWSYAIDVCGLPGNLAERLVEVYYLDIVMSALPVDYAIRLAVEQAVEVYH